MTYPNKGDFEPMSSVESVENVEGVSSIVRRWIHQMTDAPGEHENAMRDIQRVYGIGYWTLDHLRRRKAKTCDVGLSARIKAGYADYLKKKAKALLYEAEIVESMGMGEDVASIQREIAALVARLEAAKSKAKAGRELR